MDKKEFPLINGRKMIIEIETDKEKKSESVKTYIIDSKKEVEIDSVRITCTCNGQSVTKTCSRDGYCDCTGDKPKVVCT